MERILVIQTASIGDVILATPILESLHQRFPGAIIDILVKEGNEKLFDGHPFLTEVITWNKGRDKYANLFKVLVRIRAKRYHLLVNIQRFLSSGMLTAFSGAKKKVGFSKNPMSFLFSMKVKHSILEGRFHEVDRNLSLLDFLGPLEQKAKIRLYPTESDRQKVSAYQDKPYITISPASIWFTKQFPGEKWAEFIGALPAGLKVFLLGAPADVSLALDILNRSRHSSVVSLAGKLSLLESAAFMQDALMNFVNDSAPLHLCSAVNAPVTAVFCSTVSDFGFGPLSDDSAVVQSREDLHCRPCGLHGLRTCPEGHFRCAWSIQKEQLLERISL